MRDYIYDGTFDGFLNCVYHHYYTEHANGIFTKDRYQANLLCGYTEVETDVEKADRVYRAIEEKISDYDLRCVYRAFLSSIPNK